MLHPSNHMSPFLSPTQLWNACFYTLDSRFYFLHKWDHITYFSLCLAYFIWCDIFRVHLHCAKWKSQSIFRLNNTLFRNVYTCSYMHMYSLVISHVETQPFPHHDTIMDMGCRYLYEMAFTLCECALRTGAARLHSISTLHFCRTLQTVCSSGLTSQPSYQQQTRSPLLALWALWSQSC